MSKDESIEFGRIDKIYDDQIKGKVDAPWRFQSSIERANRMMSGTDVQAFEAAVRAALGDLPLRIKNTVMDRKDEFNKISAPTFEYTNTCGHNVGTPENPFIIVAGHDEWNFLNEVPRPFREKYGDKITVVSPREIEGDIYTDHERLLEIIKEEADRGGIGWKYERSSKELGPIEKILPDGISSEIESTLTELMIKHRQEGHMYSWAEMIGSQQHKTPRTPTPPKEEEE